MAQDGRVCHFISSIAADLDTDVIGSISSTPRYSAIEGDGEKCGPSVARWCEYSIEGLRIYAREEMQWLAKYLLPTAREAVEKSAVGNVYGMWVIGRDEGRACRHSAKV